MPTQHDPNGRGPQAGFFEGEAQHRIWYLRICHADHDRRTSRLGILMPSGDQDRTRRMRGDSIAYRAEKERADRAKLPGSEDQHLGT